MTPGLLCTLALIAGTDPAPTSAPDDVKAAYQQARDHAGKTPADHVRLALWCEAHGLSAQRLHHLTLAVLADPTNAAARGLMGLVLHDGRWRRPEAVAEKEKADKAALLADYQAKRLRAAYTADDQWALGLWCDEHGLADQAKAHLTAVTRLDPGRDAAWKRLGYKKDHGRWTTEAQLAVEKADAEAQKAADRRWKPLFEKYKAMLDRPSKRAEAEAALAEITDPRAVPMVVKTFAADPATQAIAVRTLGQVDSARATKALASLALFAKSAEARRAATETLRGRDAREYADRLIALLRDPIKYSVKPVAGPGSQGVLYVELPQANLRRLYSPPPTFRPGDSIMIDPSGLPVVDRRIAYEDPRPNVTGHSKYTIEGVASNGPDGTWVFSNYVGSSATANEMLYETIRAASPAPGTVPWSVIAAHLRQGIAAGGSPASALASLHGRALPPAVRDDTLANFQQELAYQYNLVANSPYISIVGDYEAPLSQVLAESKKAVKSAQDQLEADTRAIEDLNRATRAWNDRVVGVLNAATGQPFGQDREPWTKWWVDQIGYALVTGPAEPKPTIVEQVPLHQPKFTPISTTTNVVGFRRWSCFGAGTPVRTIDGPRPIESLRAGDRVLAQSTDTGALAYRPVLVTHHNPPSPTFRVVIAGKPIVSSHFHRFWVAGKGWVMARDLKKGDLVRTLGGASPVEAVEPDKVQPVFNLDVADDADFFAGDVAALVHDNTLPDARLVPFDAPAGTLAVAPSPK